MHDALSLIHLCFEYQEESVVSNHLTTTITTTATTQAGNPYFNDIGAAENQE